MKKNKLLKNLVYWSAGVLLFFSFLTSNVWAEVIDGCAAPVTSSDYSGSFDLNDFDVSGLLLDDNGDLELDTQRKVLDPNNIEIPIDQEVAVTQIYEGAGFTELKFGWLYETDVDANGNPDTSKIRWIYEDVNDNDTNDLHGDGVIDNRETDLNGDGVVNIKDNKEYLVDENDVPIKFKAGSKLVFVLDSHMMYGTADPNCQNNDWCGGVFYTKSEWNETLGQCTAAGKQGLSRVIKLWAAGDNLPTDCKNYYADCSADGANCYEQGWLTDDAITRLRDIYGYQFTAPTADDPDGFNIVDYNTANGDTAVHAILGAPNNTPDAWIIGFEDVRLDGYSTTDNDFNDMVFLIERKSGGVAQLKNSKVISPAESDAFFTKIEFEVYDGMPCDGTTSINYYYSVNFKKDENGDYLDENGVVISASDPELDAKKVPIWHEIKTQQWEQIYHFTNEDGTANLSNGQPVLSGEFDNQEDKNSEIINLAVKNLWSRGNPTYTARKAVIDLAGNGEIGRELVWKAELLSETEACAPIVFNVSIDTTVARHAIFSRAQPIVQTNMTYSGSYETPDPSDAEWIKNPELRGHLKAVEIYDPATAYASDSDGAVKWDAGQVLSDRNLSNYPRKVYFPNITAAGKHSQTLAAFAEDTSDEDLMADVKSFSGTLANKPVLDGTLVITAQTADADGNIIEVVFEDLYSDDQLVTSANASGTINRFTGAYTLNFNDYPKEDSQIVATYYSYSITAGALETLSTANTKASDTLLTLTGTGIAKNDLIKWLLGFETSGSERTWLLGAIDHSAPAVMIPPGIPSWYWGSSISNTLKDTYYDPEEDAAVEGGATPTTFRNIQRERDAVVFVGAMDGMLHAFDAGKFRWGDNPKTEYEELRGYFEWSGDSSATAQYGTGKELWAYIPGNLMPKQKNNFAKGEGSKAYVDASPSVADVYINGSWKSVLMFAQGSGGHVVTCLDVTSPASPTLLWEYGDNGLFNSQSSPSIGLVKDSAGADKWVAFFVSGSTDAYANPKIYMLDIATGTLVGNAAIDLDAAGETGQGGVGGGQPALIDSDGDGYIDRIYVGTDKGYMYRVTLTNTTTYSDIVINANERDASMGIYASPTLVADAADSVRVFFGTGGDDSSKTYKFYAYLDKGGDSVTLDWSVDLPAGHRIYTSAFASAGLLYFGTTTATSEDPCEAGGVNESKIFVFKQKLESGATTPGKVAEIDLPTGSGRTTPVVDDEHLYVKTTNGTLKSYGKENYNNGAAGEVEDTEAKAFLRSWREAKPFEY